MVAAAVELVRIVSMRIAGERQDLVGNLKGSLPVGVLKVLSSAVPLVSSEMQRLAPGKLAIVLLQRNLQGPQ